MVLSPYCLPVSDFISFAYNNNKTLISQKMYLSPANHGKTDEVSAGCVINLSVYYQSSVYLVPSPNLAPSYRECAPHCAEAAPSWLAAVGEELRLGQKKVVESLLLHADAKLFCHDYRKSLVQKVEKSPLEISSSTTLRIEETLATSANLVISDIKKSLFEEKSTAPTLLVASGNFSNLLQPLWVPRSGRDSLTGESVLSFFSSVPSSLSTDRPPSPLSISSYGETSKPAVPLEKVNLVKLLKCRVALRPLALTKIPKIKTIHKKEQEEESIASTDSSWGTDSITSQDLWEIDKDNRTAIVPEEDHHHEADYALDFNELKTLVENLGCASVMDLHLNIKKIIETFPVPEEREKDVRKTLTSYHHQLMAEVYPWFDLHDPARIWTEWEPRKEETSMAVKSTSVKIGEKRKFHVTKPDNDHEYAIQPVLRGEKYSYNEKEDIDDDAEDSDEEDDCRKCLLCGEKGNMDDQLAGRLLSLRLVI